MLLKLFKTNHPIVIFLIPLLGILLWVPSLFGVKGSIEFISLQQTTLLYQVCFSFLAKVPQLSIWLAWLFIVLQSFILIRLNFKYIFIENKTYLPAVMFVLVSSVLLPFQKLHPALIADFFVLAAMDKALVFDKERNQIKRYFESGFLLGLASLFYPNSYLLLLFVGFSLIILHNSTWREWVGTIIGFVTPLVFYFAILFLLNIHNQGFENLKMIVTQPSGLLSIRFWMVIPFGVLGFVLLIAMLWSLRFVGIKKISSRKYFTLFFWFFTLSLLTIMFHPFVGFEFIYFLAVPAAILFSIFFAESRHSWFEELTFSLTFLSIFVIIWMF